MAISTGIRRLSRSDCVKISLFGLAANALWQCLHIIIIPLLVLDFVGESQKNTYLGILTFCGLFLAMVSQPIAGAFSDRHNLKWGKRRPYILSGGLIAFIVLSGFGLLATVLGIALILTMIMVKERSAQY